MRSPAPVVSERPYLTAAEVRVRLRLSRDTVSKLITSGALKASKVGDHRNSPWRVSEEDLRDYLERKTARVTDRVTA